jgi:hypothetical protein
MTCRRTRRALCPSTPPRARQKRSVVVSIVEDSLRKSSHADVLCFLQDDLVKFISEPASPPQLVEVPEKGKANKERREVGEGDDTVVVEDTSEEDDDEETLQERFQLRSRFSALDCRIFLSFRISRLDWRLACPRHQGSRATWPASAWPRS